MDDHTTQGPPVPNRTARSPRTLRCVAALVVLALTAGCTGDAPSTVAAGPDGSEPIADAPDADDAPGGDKASGGDEESETPEGPHGSITLSGVQQVHLAGVAVAVAGITIDDHGDVYVEFEAQNVNNRTTILAQHGVQLLDDVGNGYRVLPDPDNGRLQIPSDHRAEVSLAFEGPIDASATRISLGFNGGGELRDTDESGTNSPYPTFAFRDLPLPGVGLDDEAGDPDAPIGLDLPESSVTVDDAVYEGQITGLTIEVREIRVTPLVVQLDIFARNDGDRERPIIVREPLLWAEVDDGTTDANLRYAALLTDDPTLWSDQGGRDNLLLDPGDELEATLSFRGSVPAEATGLRFGTGAIWGDDMRAGTGEDNLLYPVAVFPGLPLPEGVHDED